MLVSMFCLRYRYVGVEVAVYTGCDALKEACISEGVQQHKMQYLRVGR